MYLAIGLGLRGCRGGAGNCCHLLVPTWLPQPSMPFPTAPLLIDWWRQKVFHSPFLKFV